MKEFNKKSNKNSKSVEKIKLFLIKNLSHLSKKIKSKKSKNVSRKKLTLITNVLFTLLFPENTKKKWNAIIWACCSGFTPIVKLLLSRGAGQQYL